MTPISITVAPHEFHTSHRWLFDGLQHVYPVVFVPHSLSALPPGDPAVLMTETAGRIPAHSRQTLLYLVNGAGGTTNQEVTFSAAEGVDERLRGRTLQEKHLPKLLPLQGVQGTVFALTGGNPVWVRSPAPAGHVDIVRLPFGHNLQERLLWDNLQHGRFWFLLPLVHHIYTVLAGSGWNPPPLRAAFIVDDPNFRSLTYGFLHYPALVRTARADHFHTSIATAALDLALTSDTMARFLRTHSDVLSVSIHGDTHQHHELLRIATEAEATALICSMLRRVQEFERRHHVAVSRVVVPPNEMCSPVVLRTLRRFAVDAVCASRPWPWLGTDSWMSGVGLDDKLLGWQAGESVEGGMAVVRRTSMTENLVYRAFLNQPIIRYYHHHRFRADMELPRTTAGLINSLGGVQWMPLSQIAETNYETRVRGGTMTVRPFARRVRVAIPEPVRELRIDGQLANGEDTVVLVQGKELSHGIAAGVTPGTTVEIRLVHNNPAEAERCIPLRASVAAWFHRRLSEAVDRLRLPRTLSE